LTVVLLVVDNIPSMLQQVIKRGTVGAQWSEADPSGKSHDEAAEER